MDYGEILKKAWNIIYRHPYLWFLGFLAGGSGWTQSGFQFNVGDMGQIRDIFDGQENGVQEILVQAAGDFNQVRDYLVTNWILAASISIIVFLILILLLILSVSCEGGLVKAVAKHDQGKSSNFLAAIKEGFGYFWPIFLIRLLLPLGLLIILLILFSPVIVAIFYTLPLIGIGWGCLAAIVSIPLAIFTGLWAILGIRMAVLENQTFGRALKRAFQLIRERLGEVILLWLITIAVKIIAGLAIGFIVLVLVFLLGGISVIVGLVYLPAGIILGSLFMLILIVCLLIMGGFFSSFISGFWTLSFQQLKKS